LGLVYVAFNLVNGKTYVGQTLGTLDARKSCHKSEALNNKTGMIFHKAIRKYGFDAFEWEVIVEYSRDFIQQTHVDSDPRLACLPNDDKQEVISKFEVALTNSAEKLGIETLNSLAGGNGYNLFTGGDNRKMSKEQHARHMEKVQREDYLVALRAGVKASYERAGPEHKKARDAAIAKANTKRSGLRTKVHGIEYASRGDAARALGISSALLGHRLKSDRYPAYIMVEEASEEYKENLRRHVRKALTPENHAKRVEGIKRHWSNLNEEEYATRCAAGRRINPILKGEGND